MDQKELKTKATQQALIMENLGNTVKKMVANTKLDEIESNFRDEKLVYTLQMIPTPLGLTAVSSWMPVPRKQYLNLMQQMATNEEVQKMPGVVEKIQEIIEMIEKAPTPETQD